MDNPASFDGPSRETCLPMKAVQPPGHVESPAPEVFLAAYLRPPTPFLATFESEEDGMQSSAIASFETEGSDKKSDTQSQVKPLP